MPRKDIITYQYITLHIITYHYIRNTSYNDITNADYRRLVGE